MTWRACFAGPDRRLLIDILGKILSNAHLSYTKILTLLITYITEIRRTFCTLEMFIRWIKFITNCDKACLVYVKLKLIGKMLTLLQKTWNSVVHLSSHKLHDRVSFTFIMLFPFFWCAFVTSWTTQWYFWRPLWPSALAGRLVRLIVALALDVGFQNVKLLCISVKLPHWRLSGDGSTRN